MDNPVYGPITFEPERDIIKRLQIDVDVLRNELRSAKETLRDRFAMAALKGLIACPEEGALEGITKAAYEYADAMMKARAKQEGRG